MTHPCPSCGFEVFREPPGSYDVCPVCEWEDDEVQLRFPGYAGGANHLSLCEYQRAVLERLRNSTGQIAYRRNPAWRPVRTEECISEPDEREPFAYYWERDRVTPGSPRLVVMETFHITGRGLVAVGHGSLDGVAVGKPLPVEILRPDGGVLRRIARKELLLIRKDTHSEREVLLIEDTEIQELPVGSVLYIVDVPA